MFPLLLVQQQEAVRGQQAILNKSDGGTPVQAFTSRKPLKQPENSRGLRLSTMVISAPTVEKGLTQNNPAQPGSGVS